MEEMRASAPDDAKCLPKGKELVVDIFVVYVSTSKRTNVIVNISQAPES